MEEQERGANTGKMRRINEIGNAYGKLTVLRVNESKGVDAGLYYDCGCVCGSQIVVRGHRLRKGFTTSCGCDDADVCANEVGQRYAKWVVLRPNAKRGKHGQVYVDCACDCGTLRPVLVASLRNGYSKSCGCSANRGRKKTFRDLTGHRFEKVLVRERNRDKCDSKTWWTCDCDCGSVIILRSDKLLGGHVKSCGCGVTPDEAGKIYGKLTVEAPSQMKSGEIHWPCRCSCEKIVLKRGVDLRSGHVRACSKGCLATDRFFETGVNELIRRTKQSALGRDLGYNLSRDDVEKIIVSNCTYCNCPPSNELKTYRTKKLKFKYSGIDRIDSSKGYMPDNIVPCCDDCNVAKGDKPVESFFEWLKRASSHMSQKSWKMPSETA